MVFFFLAPLETGVAKLRSRILAATYTSHVKRRVHTPEQHAEEQEHAMQTTLSSLSPHASAAVRHEPLHTTKRPAFSMRSTGRAAEAAAAAAKAELDVGAVARRAAVVAAVSGGVFAPGLAAAATEKAEQAAVRVAAAAAAAAEESAGKRALADPPPHHAAAPLPAYGGGSPRRTRADPRGLFRRHDVELQGSLSPSDFHQLVHSVLSNRCSALTGGLTGTVGGGDLAAGGSTVDSGGGGDGAWREDASFVALFEALDGDGDGRLSFAEFERFLFPPPAAVALGAKPSAVAMASAALRAATSGEDVASGAFGGGGGDGSGLEEAAAWDNERAFVIVRWVAAEARHELRELCDGDTLELPPLVFPRVPPSPVAAAMLAAEAAAEVMTPAAAAPAAPSSLMPAPTQPEEGMAEEGAKEGRARGKSEGCEEQVAAAAAPRWQADGGLQAARARQLLRWHRAFRRRLLGPALRHWCVHVAALPAGDVADAAARHMVATGAAARILVHFSGWHVRTLGSAFRRWHGAYQHVLQQEVLTLHEQLAEAKGEIQRTRRKMLGGRFLLSQRNSDL
jgi:hypothetical protein